MDENGWYFPEQDDDLVMKRTLRYMEIFDSVADSNPRLGPVHIQAIALRREQEMDAHGG